MNNFEIIEMILKQPSKLGMNRKLRLSLVSFSLAYLLYIVRVNYIVAKSDETPKEKNKFRVQRI
jgi:hypothetical protein